LWVDKADLKNCTDSGKYTADVNNETSEWRRLFAVSGTPGNVIIDNETGKFALIPGAYPAEKFIEEIEKLKNN
jgi:thioredoxin-related protein